MYFQPLATSPGLDRRGISIAKPSLNAAAALTAEYIAAMNRPWADAPLSKRGTPEYARIRRERRCDLEAILKTGISSENRVRALDIICAICEESSWGETPETPFEDAMHPVIDLFAAETACLLGWAVKCGGFDVRTQSRMVHEIRARVTTPIMAHDDYPCLSGKGFAHLATVCDAMAAALLAETDNARLFTFLRRISRMADRLVDAYRPAPIDSQLMDWTSATALWQIFRKMAGPQAGGRALPLPGWLDSLLISYMGSGEMADPMGEGARRTPNGMDIFFLGKCAGDNALCALGASLYRREDVRLSSLNARMLTDLTPAITSEMTPVPRLRHGAVAGGSIMMARGGGTHVIMHASGRENSGGMFVSVGGVPVIYPVSCTGPVINGMKQTAIPGEGDWDFANDRADLYCDMTKCYPEAAGVGFFQRTLMLDRNSGSVRVIDIIESRRPGSIEYTFAMPAADGISETGARAGNCRMLWDPAQPRAEKSPRNGMPMIHLDYELAPGRNMMNFYIEKL